MLIFAKTKCRFTMRAFPSMKKLHDDSRANGVRVVIINRGEEPEKIVPIYEELVSGVTVLHDRTQEITESYGVSAVPFFFLLDPQHRIIERMPYTYEAADNAINVALGLTTECSTTESGAG